MEVNPSLVNKYGLSLEDIRAFLGSTNAIRPKGDLDGPFRTWALNTNDQLMKAADYAPLVVAYTRGAPGEAVRCCVSGGFGGGGSLLRV